jgi:hypothetical protein
VTTITSPHPNPTMNLPKIKIYTDEKMAQKKLPIKKNKLEMCNVVLRPHRSEIIPPIIPKV